MVLQALALYGGGQRDKSFQLLEELMPLAESSGNIRVFTDESKLITGLLSYAMSKGLTSDFIKKIMDALNSEEQKKQKQSPVDLLRQR